MRKRVGWPGLIFLASVLILVTLGIVMVAEAIAVTTWKPTLLSKHLLAVGMGIVGFVSCALIPPRFQLWIGAVVYVAGLSALAILRWFHDVYSWQINTPVWAANVDCWWVAGGLLLFSGLNHWASQPTWSKQLMVAGLIGIATFSAIQLPLELGYNFTTICWIVAMLAVLFGSRLRWIVSLNIAVGTLILMIIVNMNTNREFAAGLWYFVEIEDFFPESTVDSNSSAQLIAIGNGGLAGHSESAEMFAPDTNYWWQSRNSRAVLSIWSENTGFVGSIAVLLVFAALLGSCLWIGAQVRDQPGSGLAVAVACIFFLRIYLTYGLALGISPWFRWRIPLLTWGPVDMVTNLALLGCVFATWIYREHEEKVSPNHGRDEE